LKNRYKVKKNTFDKRKPYEIGGRNQKKKIPILQFTQLLGLALELPPKKLGLNINFTNIKPLLNKIEHIKQIQKGEETFISEEIQYD